MSINLYTCSQADLETLNGVGPKSTSDIISMRNEVLGGKRPKMTITDLASIRLQPENWQQFISDGLLSITFHAAKDPDDKVMAQTSPTDKHQLTGRTTTATAHAPVIPSQTVTENTMTMTVQTPTTAAQMPTKQTPIHAASPEELIQESVKILAHHGQTDAWIGLFTDTKNNNDFRQSRQTASTEFRNKVALSSS